MNYTATYSPEDNKLRLYASERLPKELYERVRAAGFIWAPKQELFVAPAWTPQREDLLLELCGEIGDEDKSLVDRAEERAERFEDYSASRAQDADQAHKAVHAIADNIPLGQPILVGHHSEKRARKDAEKIKSGMRKAVKMWEESKYWTDRAKGAIAHAKYKELPAVRHRRLKGLEADERAEQKTKAHAEMCVRFWSGVMRNKSGELVAVNYENAVSFCNGIDHVSKCFTLAEYPRTAPASQYEGSISLWSALGGSEGQQAAIITVEQAGEIALRVHRRVIANCDRWLQHLENRVLYERAMLEEAGGAPDSKFDLKPGGRALVKGEWLVILRVNKSPGPTGTVNSITTKAPAHVNWCKVWKYGVETIADYKPPTEDEAAKVKAATKLPPMCNYPGEGFRHMTKAEWERKSPDYRGSQILEANDKHGRHRVRKAYGYGAGNGPVYLTDDKRKDPPAPPAGPPEAAPEFEVQKIAPTYTREPEKKHMRKGAKIPSEVIPILQAATFTADSVQLTGERLERNLYLAVNKVIEAAGGKWDKRKQVHIFTQDPKPLFNLEAGHINISDVKFEGIKQALKSGVQAIAAPQLFPTPPELARRMADEAGILAGKSVLEPSAGTGNLIRAAINNATGLDCGLKITAVEHNYNLAQALEQQRQKTLYANESNFRIVNADFLQCNPDHVGAETLGYFDVVLMNPPFENGADIKHIKHAMKFLKPGGYLVAICAGGPRQKEALEHLADLWEPLPAGTFEQSGTGVNTVLLTITAADGPSDEEAQEQHEADKVQEHAGEASSEEHRANCKPCQREFELWQR